AERHVHVERQATRDRIAVARRGGFAQLRFAEGGMELRRGGIGRVARRRAIVAAQQVGVEDERIVVHAETPGASPASDAMAARTSAASAASVPPMGASIHGCIAAQSARSAETSTGSARRVACNGTTTSSSASLAPLARRA